MQIAQTNKDQLKAYELRQNTTASNDDGLHCVHFPTGFVAPIGERYQEEIQLVSEEGEAPVLKKVRVSLFDPPFKFEKADASNLPENPRTREVNGGLLPIAHYLAKQQNCDEPRLFANVRCAKQLPKPKNLTLLPSLAGFVRNDRGIIRVDSPEQAPQLIASVAIEYPESRIVVLANGNQKVEKITGEIKSRLPFPLRHQVEFNHSCRACQFGESDAPQYRVMVATPATSARFEVALSTFVFLVDARTCLSKPVQEALATMDGNFRMFAIAWNDSSNACESKIRMKMFGPAKLYVKHGNRVRRQVDFFEVKIESPTRDGKSHRHSIQYNKCRNKTIAEVANGIAEGRANPSRTDGSNIAASIVPVVVLVDNRPQFTKLAKLLPTWRLFVARRAIENRLPKPLQRRIEEQRSKWNEGEPTIVLAEGSCHQKFIGFSMRYLVWASGGKDTSAIPNSWLFQKDEGKSRPLTIVDFSDKFSKEASLNWRRRRKDFQRRDIFSAGCGPIEGRIKAFLSRTYRCGGDK